MLPYVVADISLSARPASGQADDGAEKTGAKSGLDPEAERMGVGKNLVTTSTAQGATSTVLTDNCICM